jgi:type II secretory pathway pseudopilin PulG
MNNIFLKSLFNKKHKRIIPNFTSGFTLVETMVAVLILTLTIVSLMTVVANSLFAARYARDEITAGYLLQEVVDSIKNDRDTMVYLQNTNTVDDSWITFKTKYNSCSATSGTNGGGCYFDVLAEAGNANPIPCTSTIGCRDLYFDSGSTTSFYTNTSGGSKVKSPFQRKVLFEVDPVNSNQVKVTATVYWKNGGLNKTRTLTNILMKWQCENPLTC